MSVKTSKEQLEKEEIVDDVTTAVETTPTAEAAPETVAVLDEDALDNERLARLKEKLAKKKGEDMSPPVIVEEKIRSIKFGVIGSGGGGSRLAEVWYSLGYDAVAINTATQDLQPINMPDANKLFLDHGLGGAAKELEIGQAAAEAHRDAINELVNKKLGNCQMLLFCTSLGGGSGAGSAEVVIDILLQLGKPIAVITILPQSTDDAQTKHNALQTLSKLTKLVQARKVDNLIVVDNAKIETIYKDVGQFNFFPVSNKAIIEPIDQFNTLSSKASPVKGLDPTEFGKIFTDGQGLTIYGTMTVENYEDETAIAEAVVDNLSGSLLASGFDLKKARYVGAIFAANQKVWDKIPNSSVNYAMAMINDVCGAPLGVFKGIYSVPEIEEDAIRVYSMFSGLALPTTRVDQLKAEAKERIAKSEQKDEERKVALKLDAEDETISAADAIKKHIASKKSSFGKLTNQAVIDRRKK